MRDYFCGWYLRCQNEMRTIAVIPAFHVTNGEKSCSIQLITDESSWNISFPYSSFHRSKTGVEIEGNRFSNDGISLDLNTSELTASGTVSFGPLTTISYDIMGPFKYVPFMECRHSVFSMKHRVDGVFVINGVRYEFVDGTGYMEGDRGHSFPGEYAWTQCSFPKGALMLSVADIPFCGLHFTGVIGVIHCRDKEYRIATYCGARAVRIHNGELVIRQGQKQLTVRLMEKKAHPLAAPVGGSMLRTIHETASSRAYYHFQDHGCTIFELEIPNAAFEYEYPQ